MAEIHGVKFVDIPSQYVDIEEKIIAAITNLIRTGAFVGGPVLADFETKLAEYLGTKFAVGCSDGTSALMLSLLAACMGHGDIAIIPANTFIATANAVIHAGGTVALVDCDPKTYLIDLNQTEEVLRSGKAKFIIPVHLYGNPCPMVEIMSLADKYGAKVVEDNAQAIGAEINGKRTGSFGLAGGVSFYPAKNLGAFGQGGAILTSDEYIATSARMYIEQGQGSQKYHHEVIGYNARLHAIQACVLSILLDKLNELNAARCRAAQWYAEHLPADRIQQPTKGGTHVYHLFEYRCDGKAQRDALANALKAANIGFGYHYPIPIHKQNAYLKLNRLSFPVAERLADTLISLPMHPGLTESQVKQVCDVVLSL